VHYKQNGYGKTDGRQQVGMWRAGLIIGVPALALLGFAGYCATLGSSAVLSALGVGLGVAAAATAVGAFWVSFSEYLELFKEIRHLDQMRSLTTGRIRI